MNHNFKKLFKIAQQLDMLSSIRKSASVDAVEDALGEIRSYGDDLMTESAAALKALEESGVENLDVSDLSATVGFVQDAFSTLEQAIDEAVNSDEEEGEEEDEEEDR